MVVSYCKVIDKNGYVYRQLIRIDKDIMKQYNDIVDNKINNPKTSYYDRLYLGYLEEGLNFTTQTTLRYFVNLMKNDKNIKRIKSYNTIIKVE